MADYEKELHDLKTLRKKQNVSATNAPNVKKEKKQSNFRTILQYNTENILSLDFIYKTLTKEIEEFCEYLRIENEKVAVSRKFIIGQLTSLIRKEFKGYDVAF